MNLQPAIRACSMGSVLGGLALVLFALLHPERDVRAALEPLWVWEHQLGVIAFALIPAGLFGLYGVQTRETGIPGLVAFGVAFVGTVLYSAGIFMDAYFFPWLAVEAPAVVTAVLEANLSGPPLVGLGLASVLFTFGLILAGAVTFRAGTLPRVPAILVVLGAPLFGPGSALPKAIQVGGAVALGAGLIWLGYAAWKVAEPARR